MMHLQVLKFWENLYKTKKEAINLVMIHIKWKLMSS
jgi:hypothetical protein